MYGYLQKGNFEKAREMVYDMKGYCQEKPSSKARAHYVMMKADYLTESGNWKDSLAIDTVDLDKLNLLVQGVEVFTHGMAGYENGNREAVNKAIIELNNMQSNAETKMVFGSPKMCSGVSRNLQSPSVNEVNSVKVLEHQLNALVALIDSDDTTAEEWMQKATELEASTTFNYGPPNIVKPSFELYGEWLVSKNRKEEAKDQFEIGLKRAPNRRLSMHGLENVSAL